MGNNRIVPKLLSPQVGREGRGRGAVEGAGVEGGWDGGRTRRGFN